jgi:hypothetical protein
METLPDQFKDALSRIEIKDEQRTRANQAHTEIRRHLEDDELLCSWGVDTVLIGSYARHTGIHPGKDVDVFTKLTKLDTSVAPGKVYEAVRQVLVDRYGDRAEPQKRSIKVSFDSNGDGFAVDVVPAVKMGSRWGIPRRDTAKWEAPDEADRWVETDPEKLADLATKMNDTLKVNGQGAYKPVVKLVRQIRKHHFDKDQKPGGFYFELLTYWAFKGGASGDSFAEILTATLRAIAAQLASSSPLTDPVLDRPYRPEPEPNELAIARTTFGMIAAKADEALRQEKCAAAATWRWILGENDRGPCFPLPPGCDEQGNPIKNVAAVAAVGAKEASGFA